MEQLEFFQIPSPCVGVCESNNRGFCKGCFRSRDERLYWLQLTDAQKREVLRLCQQRRYKVWLAKQHQHQNQHEDEVEVFRTDWLFETKDEKLK